MSTVTIKDQNETITISFEDLRKYHGGGALMALAVGLRVVGAAIRRLYGDEIPERQALSIFSGHAGPGFRDAFEFVTRAVTRNAYEVDINYPKAQYDPYRAQSYAFTMTTDGGLSVEILLRPDFLPVAFYEYMDKGRRGVITDAEIKDFAELRETLAKRAIELPENELLEIIA